ncbi:hypothetical protein B7C42_01649 [Nocardia cerradoensis]|uniref:Tail assembly chaperone n=1 Tax=Nocardia cerradoensis TaxID=85688 RepID=A0A231HCP0_9NOCA|nr:hypothetical protein [Nocardia cerradoensis]OXR46674.1 hypothetical protein B7C42_01649 [Nocardia cerradoensis]
MSEPISTPTAGVVPPALAAVPGTVPSPSAPPPPPDPVELGDTIRNMVRFREQGLEGLGAAAGIKFQPGGPGTEVFTIPHPLLMSDEQNEELAKPQGFLGIAKLILNSEADPHVYERFRAAGGQAGDVMIAWRTLSNGLDVPKSE